MIFLIFNSLANVSQWFTGDIRVTLAAGMKLHILIIIKNIFEWNAFLLAGDILLH